MQGGTEALHTHATVLVGEEPQSQPRVPHSPSHHRIRPAQWLLPQPLPSTYLLPDSVYSLR